MHGKKKRTESKMNGFWSRNIDFDPINLRTMKSESRILLSIVWTDKKELHCQSQLDHQYLNITRVRVL